MDRPLDVSNGSDVQAGPRREFQVREPEAEPGSSERPCDAILFGDEPASENGLNRRPAAGQWN